MAYDWKLFTALSGATSWQGLYTRLGPTNWRPETKLNRTIKLLVVIPWSVVWMIGILPMIVILGLIGGTYNYIKYNDFLP